jgi:predicted nucleic acid-binding protein
MIWVDSSFVVEWLLGTERVQSVNIKSETLSILDNQYCEVVAFFRKRDVSEQRVVSQLERLILERPEREDLVYGASLYLKARNAGSKASLSDAILAAVVAKDKKHELLAYDYDFEALGLTSDQTKSRWRR